MKEDQWMKKSNNMIGCTWMDGRGQLFSEASAHIMLYIIYIYILYIYTADVNITSTKPNAHEVYPV